MQRLRTREVPPPARALIFLVALLTDPGEKTNLHFLRMRLIAITYRCRMVWGTAVGWGEGRPIPHPPGRYVFYVELGY